MPLYQSVTYASGTTGTQPSINMDPSIAPFNATIAVTLTGGTTSFKMQWSISPFETVSDANANWFDSTDIPASSAASKTSFVTTPYARVRLVIASLSGGNLVLETQQGISKN